MYLWSRVRYICDVGGIGITTEGYICSDTNPHPLNMCSIINVFKCSKSVAQKVLKRAPI